MKKTLLIAAAGLFVIGQAFAEGQAPANQQKAQQSTQQSQQQRPQNNAGQQTPKEQKAGQQTTGQKQASAGGKSRKAMGHKKAKRTAHRTRHHQRMAASPQGQQPMQQGFRMGGGYQGPKTMPACKGKQKPDGITCW